MKVLAVLPGLNGHGGAERSFAATAGLVREQGIDLHLALLTTRRGLVPTVEALGVPVHDLSGARGAARAAVALTSLVRDLRPDLVHATLHEAEVPASLAAAVTRTPLLVTWASTVRTPEAEGGVPAWKLQLVLAADAVLGRVAGARYHAVTEGVGRSRAEALRAPSNRVRIAERGRDPELYAPVAEQELVAAREDVGLDPADRLVLVVGRHEPAKGLERVVALVDPLVDRVPGAVVAIAGREGSSTARLQRAAAELRHRDRFRLLGHRSDLPTLLQLASVTLCTSHREGAAAAVLEAWACGCPVVTVPLEGLDGVVVDGRNGLVRPVGELVDAVAALLGDPAAAEQLAVAGRATFLERYTVRRSVEQLVGVYRWAARRGGAPTVPGAVAAGGQASATVGPPPTGASGPLVRVLGEPRVSAALSGVTAGRLRALAYHGVPDAAAFRAQLELLADEYRVVTAADVAAAVDGARPLPPKAVWITFDDARPDVVDAALPELERLGLPATVFVCPGVIAEEEPYWFDLVRAVARRSGVELDGEVVRDRSIGARLKAVPDGRRRALLASLDRSVLRPGDLPAQMTREQLDRWVAAGMTVGNHTWDHPCLDRCTADEQRQVITRAHEALTEWLGAPPEHFAYPNGDWTPECEPVLADLGYRVAALFDHHLARPQADARYRLSRLRADSDAPPERLRAVLSGAHSGLFGVAGRVRGAVGR